MQIHVQLFSILRECLPPDAKRGQAIITLSEDATLADLVVHLGIDRYLVFAAADIIAKASWQVMVSGQFVTDMGRILRDGDEVRIFPPVAGG